MFTFHIIYLDMFVYFDIILPLGLMNVKHELIKMEHREAKVPSYEYL